MQASLLSGVVASEAAEFRTSSPTNLEPVFVKTNISKGQLRSALGATQIGTGPGTDRGATVWNGTLYRVMGTSLVQVSATGDVTVRGDVGGTGYVAFAQSFDRLAIASGGKLFYFDGSAVTQMIDGDLGTVNDLIWVDGFFMTTDGTYATVTELSDPYQVKPLKYGSAEDDPDSITGLIRIPGSVDTHVCGRFTIQVFQNKGGAGFPFDTVRGATIPFGCVSASAKTLYGKTFAFVGGAKGDALGVYVAGQGTANKISTREVDNAIAAVADPTAIVLERRVDRDELRLIVRLPGEAWCFYAKGTEMAQEPVWTRLTSGVEQPYRLVNAALAYGQWIVGDANSGAIGRLDDQASTHFGEIAQWRFDVGLLYASKPAVVHSVMLEGLSGRGGTGSAFMSITRDGETFGVERAVTLAPVGARQRRLAWRPHLRLSGYMGLRFRGYGDAVVGFASCEVT